MHKGARSRPGRVRLACPTNIKLTLHMKPNFLFRIQPSPPQNRASIQQELFYCISVDRWCRSRNPFSPSSHPIPSQPSTLSLPLKPHLKPSHTTQKWPPLSLSLSRARARSSPRTAIPKTLPLLRIAKEDTDSMPALSLHSNPARAAMRVSK